MDLVCEYCKRDLSGERWKCSGWCGIQWYFCHDCLDNRRKEVDKLICGCSWCDGCCPFFHGVKTRKPSDTVNKTGKLKNEKL